jgi:hypothetical protein
MRWIKNNKFRIELQIETRYIASLLILKQIVRRQVGGLKKFYLKFPYILFDIILIIGNNMYVISVIQRNQRKKLYPADYADHWRIKLVDVLILKYSGYP